MKSAVKSGERDVETMKPILRGTSVAECPSMKVMKNVIQEKNEGPGEVEVQEVEEGPEVLKIDVEEEVQEEIPAEIGLVEAVDLEVEAQGGAAAGNLILLSNSDLPVSVKYIASYSGSLVIAV